MAKLQPKVPVDPVTSEQAELGAGVRRLTRSVEIADILGVLMIFVTAFSGYATWTTARLASQLLTITARPYLGSQGVHFDRIDTNEPRVVVDLRNFGTVQATNTVITGHLFYDDKEIAGHKGPRSTTYAGVFSPGVPHPTYFHLPANLYNDAVAGKGKLQLRLEMRYTGLNDDQHCYKKAFTYDDDDSQFYSDHGTLACK